MDRINRLIIFGFLTAFAMGELNAMNQTFMVQARSRVPVAAIGGALGYVLGKKNNPLIKSPFRQSLLYGALFAFFNTPTSALSALYCCVFAGRVAHALGFAGWQKAALVGAVCGGVCGKAVDILRQRNWQIRGPQPLTIRINPEIDQQEDNISQHDPEFVRINSEFDEHATQRLPYQGSAHREGIIAGKRWSMDIEAKVLHRNDRGEQVTCCREWDEKGTRYIRFEARQPQ